MPEFKVGDRVTVGEFRVRKVDGRDPLYPALVEFERPDPGTGTVMFWPHLSTIRLTPPGVLGYSEEGHELRRGADIPDGWERRWRTGDAWTPTIRWTLRSALVAIFECRPPEPEPEPEPEPQSLADAARELLGWERDGLVPSWPLDNLRAALEREGRSDG